MTTSTTAALIKAAREETIALVEKAMDAEYNAWVLEPFAEKAYWRMFKAALAAIEAQQHKEAEARVLAARGSYDAPGFDACVLAELKNAIEAQKLPTGGEAVRLFIKPIDEARFKEVLPGMPYEVVKPLAPTQPPAQQPQQVDDAMAMRECVEKAQCLFWEAGKAQVLADFKTHFKGWPHDMHDDRLGFESPEVDAMWRGWYYSKYFYHIEQAKTALAAMPTHDTRHQRACEVLREVVGTAQVGFRGAYVHEVVVLRKDKLEAALARADAILKGEA